MKWLSKISHQDLLIDYGSKASPSAWARISGFLKNLFLLLVIGALSAYAGWLTVERAAQQRYEEGVTVGYAVGEKQGREKSCGMIRPI